MHVFTDKAVVLIEFFRHESDFRLRCQVDERLGRSFEYFLSYRRKLSVYLVPRLFVSDGFASYSL
jgi:hypothetical protein